MHVEPGHPDAARPLLAHAARALEAMGAEVVIHGGDDNLVRSRRPGDPGAAPYVVLASGLPNLLHELVHVLRVGRLADDHGLDYGQIPYDLADPAHRQILWDELAACVLSCAYVEPALEAAWFAEQVGIQGVFYGHDPAAFLAAVERAVAAHADELERTLAAAYADLEAALAGAGAPPEQARPRAVLRFSALWARLRAGCHGRAAGCSALVPA
jgi:hypothetical protein